MEDLCRDLKIIFSGGEEVIGRVVDIIELHYRSIMYNIQNVEDFEERATAVTLENDFINELINAINEEEIEEDTVIKESEDINGFYYEIV